MGRNKEMRNEYRRFRFVVSIICFSLITYHLPLITFLHGASPVHINEVASEEISPDRDWVELYIASGPIDMSEWKLYEKSSLVKTFPATDFVYNAGTYIVVNFKSSLKDETTFFGDMNGNGAVDVYTSDSGLTGTSNVLSIRDSHGVIIDGVVYSDGSSWTSSQQKAFDVLVATGQWTGTIQGGKEQNFSEAVTVINGIGSGNSIARDETSGDSDDLLEAKDDWTHLKSKQTKGKVNPTIAVCLPGSGYVNGSISEVAPSIPRLNGGDFVEIFIAKAANLCGAKLFEKGALIKTFPSVTPRSEPFGPYVVLHAGIEVSELNPDETDLTGDLNGNGVVDLYSDETSPGLIGGSGNALTLKNVDGFTADFVAFSHGTSPFVGSLKNAYDSAVSVGQWFPDCREKGLSCYHAGSVSWNDSSSRSMSRKISGEGTPLDSSPSSANDWTVGVPTRGRGYGSDVRPEPGMLEVTQSPFSPFGDGRFREALIGYRVSGESTVTVGVYNVKGRLILTLLDNSIARNSQTQTVTWDGRDMNDRIVPVGVYVVSMEARSPNGSVSKDTKTVVVGRKL